MIVVTGATGKLGQQILEGLLGKIPAQQSGVSVRNPEKAQTFEQRGVRVRQGNFEDPKSLDHAFEGAAKVLIVSSNAGPLGGDPIAQHDAAISAAKAAGAKRILYTSHIGAPAPDAPSIVRVHLDTEDLLAKSGVAWTALRNGYYADSAFRFMGPKWQETGIHAPADGKVSWTTHKDLADAAVALLLEEQTFEGPTPPLTGSEALDLSDIAEIGTNLLRHTVQRAVVEDEAYRQTLRNSGLPESIASLSLDSFRASRRGDFETVDPTLESLIGRPPVTFGYVLKQAVTASRPA